MKLLTRILAAPLLAVACLVASGLVGNGSMQALADQFETLKTDKLATARTLSGMQTRMATMNAQLYRTVTVIDGLDPAALQAVVQQIDTETRALGAVSIAMKGRIDPAMLPKLDGVIADLAVYRDKSQQAIKMAESSPALATVFLASAEKSFATSFKTLQSIGQSVDAEVEAMSSRVGAIATRGLTLIVGLTVVAVAASLSVAWWSGRNIVRRLASAVEISEAVARGELDVTVPAGPPDEVGRLLDSLRTTVTRLSDSLTQIHRASASIHTASSEIAAGSLDLSGRTERTASHLQSTSGSMTTLTDTVGQSAAAARQASELAETASSVAVRGGTMVSAVIATMDDINAGSKRIADITSTIDGIAFQTNILALNAAVEAARAGEQGRGFAVVASEVRALAQRSAAAAREIKALTGASVDKAEHGARLAAEAGTTMTDIVVAVRKVDAMIADISTATGQQTSGIAEVGGSVALIDQMTQQNAALVEQSAAASESLLAQSARLEKVVGSFRLQASVG